MFKRLFFYLCLFRNGTSNTLTTYTSIKWVVERNIPLLDVICTFLFQMFVPKHF